MKHVQHIHYFSNADLKKKYIHQEQICCDHSGKSCNLEVLNSKRRLIFFVTSNISHFAANFLFYKKWTQYGLVLFFRRNLLHLVFVEIQYFQFFRLEGTHFHSSHFQISLLLDFQLLILISCFNLKMFLFLLSVDKN